MNYEVVTDEAYKMRGVWPKGWYAANVKYPGSEPTVTVRKSKSELNMFVVDFEVFNTEGALKNIRSYVMAEGKAAWQLRSAAEALGLLEAYRAGTLAADDLVGKSCWVKLDIEEDPTGQYEPKNVIRDYSDKPKGSATASPSQSVTASASARADLDDDIPF